MTAACPGSCRATATSPELGVGYVMLLNATHSPRAYAEIRGLLFAYLAQGRQLPEPPTVRPDPARGDHAAFYRFGNPRHSLARLHRAGSARMGRRRHRRRHAGQQHQSARPSTSCRRRTGRTACRGTGAPRIRFGQDADGQPVMVAGWGVRGAGLQAGRDVAGAGARCGDAAPADRSGVVRRVRAAATRTKAVAARRIDRGLARPSRACA